MTVKLPAPLEQTLRQRSAALGRPASELIREALQAYLANAPDVSAYGLGKDLFGLYRGPADLSKRRNQGATDIWGEKHDRRTAKR
jgi:Ribbon-helix-helix protein, copG family